MSLPELLRAEQPVAGVAEAGADVAVLVQAAVDRGGEHRHVGMVRGERAQPSGAAIRQTKRIRVAPASLSRVTAAMAELPVASIGSTTMHSRSCTSSGSFR